MKSPKTDALAEELYKNDSPPIVRAAKMMMLAQSFESEGTQKDKYRLAKYILENQ